MSDDGLPRGMTAQGGGVTVSYGARLHALLWFAAALPVARSPTASSPAPSPATPPER